MEDYVTPDQDNGGVHINSGIPNHAFYALRDRARGRHGRARAGSGTTPSHRGDLVPDSDFAAFAGATVSAATDRYGQGSAEREAVLKSWSVVGVTADGAPSRAA